MNTINQQVLQNVQNALAQGRSKEDLYKELLNQGLTIEAIQEIFNATTADVNKEDTSKKTIHMILVIGVVLIAAGIFSFIAANWLGMPKAIKVVIILSAMITSYGMGWHFKENSELQKTGDALIFLGSAIYGAGIFLVAQMFHIRANWPDGFILWMIGTIAMAFAVTSYPLFYLAILLGIVAVIGHPFSILTGFGDSAFLLTSSLLLLGATVVTFITGWIIRKKVLEEFKNSY